MMLNFLSFNAIKYFETWARGINKLRKSYINYVPYFLRYNLTHDSLIASWRISTLAHYFKLGVHPWLNLKCLNYIESKFFISLFFALVFCRLLNCPGFFFSFFIYLFWTKSKRERRFSSPTTWAPAWIFRERSNYKSYLPSDLRITRQGFCKLFLGCYKNHAFWK